MLAVRLLDSMRGAPRRWNRHPLVRLRRGEWVRWQINHRVPGRWDGPWRYELTTLNLAYGAVADLRLFLGAPTRFADERAALR